jgi:hypothetical protein
VATRALSFLFVAAVGLAGPGGLLGCTPTPEGDTDAGAVDAGAPSDDDAGGTAGDAGDVTADAGALPDAGSPDAGAADAGAADGGAADGGAADAGEERDASTGANRAPTIVLTRQSSSYSVPGGVDLEVEAADEDGDALTISWRTTAGTLGTPSQSGTEGQVHWDPDGCIADRVVVTVEVSDGEETVTSELYITELMVVAAEDFPVRFQLDDSVDSFPDGSCGPPITGGQDVAFSFVAPATDSYRFHTSGTTLDALVYVLADPCGGAELACDDDDSLTGQLVASRIEMDLTEGQRITLVIQGLESSAGREVQVNLGPGNGQSSCAPDGCNQVCATATVGPGDFPLDLDTRLSSDDYVSPTCGSSSGPDEIRAFTADADGTFTFEFDAFFDGTFYAFDGLCPTGELQCSEYDNEHWLTFDMAAGETISLVVDGVDTWDFGFPTLRLRSTYVDAFESDDTPESANALPLDGTPVTAHTVAPRSDVDYYTFTAVAGNSYAVTTDDGTGCSPLLGAARVTLSLFEEDGATSVATTPVAAPGACRAFEWTAPTSGTYRIAVRASPSASDEDAAGSYQLTALEIED